MRLLFVDRSQLDYHVETPRYQPLGGTESAICYLCIELAALGHEVYLLNNGSTPGVFSGVHCERLGDHDDYALFGRVDRIVCVKEGSFGKILRSRLEKPPSLLLWLQHADNEAAVGGLQDATNRDAYDAFVFVSQWQQNRFVERFSIDPGRSAIMGNAVAPCFEGLLEPSSPILAHKSAPPVLAYTSTPFRGLELLVQAFPIIRARLPDVTLAVFSDLRGYQVSADEDPYRRLYDLCRSIDGIEYVGSVSQRELAARLGSVTLFAYPNTFAETFCTCALEAMASGCLVVTSDLGALPETTAGFAELIPYPSGDQPRTRLVFQGEGGAVTLTSTEEPHDAYVTQFAAACVRGLRSVAEDAERVDAHLRRQVYHVHQTGVWSARAREWERLLQNTK